MNKPTKKTKLQLAALEVIRVWSTPGISSTIAFAAYAEFGKRLSKAGWRNTGNMRQDQMVKEALAIQMDSVA